MNFNTFFSVLKKNGIEFYSGVPDSYLNGFCNYLKDNMTHGEHILAANEGNAVAIAAGVYMSTGKLPLVYMQNSGIGNATDPLLSLVCKNVLSIPLVLLVGWRGQPGKGDWIHHRLQGKITRKLFNTMDIPNKVMNNENYENIVMWACKTAKKINSPVAIVVEKGVLQEKKNTNFKEEYSMSREDVIRCVLSTIGNQSFCVGTTGRVTRELYYVRENLGQGHKNDIFNVGAMGHASGIAMGLAHGNPKKTVYCFDGDGSAIMHMGAMAINGCSNASNFVHIVLNNGLHESVGGQPSVGLKINFNTIAKSCGYYTIDKPIEDEKELICALQTKHDDKPLFLDVRVHPGIKPEYRLLQVNHKQIKQELMKSFQE